MSTLNFTVVKFLIFTNNYATPALQAAFWGLLTRLMYVICGNSVANSQGQLRTARPTQVADTTMIL